MVRAPFLAAMPSGRRFLRVSNYALRCECERLFGAVSGIARVPLTTYSVTNYITRHYLRLVFTSGHGVVH